MLMMLNRVLGTEEAALSERQRAGALLQRGQDARLAAAHQARVAPRRQQARRRRCSQLLLRCTRRCLRAGAERSWPRPRIQQRLSRSERAALLVRRARAGSMQGAQRVHR
jgi:hypothetical protein